VSDDRELELTYAYETLKHIVDLWGGKVILKTFVDGKRKQIVCDEQRKISMTAG
jgi:stage V sporulation protein R